MAHWAELNRMLTNALRGRSNAKTTPAEPLAIGEPDREVVACPSCARPLSSDTGRCPGCGSRLILGVQAHRAGLFVGVGLAAGLMIGATTAGIMTRPRHPDTIPATAGAPSSIQTGAAGSSSDGTLGDPASRAASAGISSLRQASVINGRLAGGLPDLQTEIAATQFDAVAVARTLRDMAADATLGADQAARVAAWPAGAALGAQLSDFYANVRATARDGLSVSVTDEVAYKDAAARMVTLLGSISQLDEATRLVLTQGGAPANSTVSSTSP